MKLRYKGVITGDTKISSLIKILEASKDGQLWNYRGLNVELDPMIDYKDENILVRWLDIEEGFNDKIIVHSLEEFNQLFTPLITY